jgi:hypothetical protein
MNTQFQTNRLLWSVLGGAVFLLAWLIPTGTDKAPYFGSPWVALLRGEWLDPWPRAIWELGIPTLLIGVVALVLGWILQAIVIVVSAAIREWKRGRKRVRSSFPA